LKVMTMCSDDKNNWRAIETNEINKVLFMLH
jgi:hypothetical protein